LTVTLQQLQANGFSLVYGTGERIQVWTGMDTRPGAGGAGVNIAWDSVSGRQKFLDDVSYKAMVPLFAVLAVLHDLITALPNATVALATKNALKAQLLAALDED
jgi:hypothetical protein